VLHPPVESKDPELPLDAFGVYARYAASAGIGDDEGMGFE
jgi:hypothetical protein